MNTCIFCTIIAKKIPNYTVYEDAHVLAFLDIYPHAKGHTVVIPKEHRETMDLCTDEEISQWMVGVRHTMSVLQKTVHPDGFTIGWNHREAGGQAVPHLHMHIFPRWHGDGGGSMHAVINNPGDVPVADIAAIIAAAKTQ